MVLWMDIGASVPRSSLQGLWNQTRDVGVVTWEISNRCATSSFTFPKMLAYFGFTQEDIIYESMIEVRYYSFI